MPVWESLLMIGHPAALTLDGVDQLPAGLWGEKSDVDGSLAQQFLALEIRQAAERLIHFDHHASYRRDDQPNGAAPERCREFLFALAQLLLNLGLPARLVVKQDKQHSGGDGDGSQTLEGLNSRHDLCRWEEPGDGLIREQNPQACRDRIDDRDEQRKSQAITSPGLAMFVWHRAFS